MERKRMMRTGIAALMAMAVAVPAMAQGWGQQQGQPPGQRGWAQQAQQAGQADGPFTPRRPFDAAGSRGQAGFGPLGDPPANFAELDADGDGSVTLAELLARRDARFAAADADEDGVLGVAELVAAREAQRLARIEAMAERLVTAFDADGDGSLSMGELPGNDMAGQFLMRLDADGDGAVSQAEYDARMQGFGARVPGDRGPRR